MSITNEVKAFESRLWKFYVWQISESNSLGFFVLLLFLWEFVSYTVSSHHKIFCILCDFVVWKSCKKEIFMGEWKCTIKIMIDLNKFSFFRGWLGGCEKFRGLKGFERKKSSRLCLFIKGSWTRFCDSFLADYWWPLCIILQFSENFEVPSANVFFNGV